MRDSLKLFRFLKPYWRQAALAPLLMVLEVAMDAAVVAHARRAPGARGGLVGAG